ncbi:MAG: tRNA pseudouridine(55) synthase TruB [Gammaproteobacteria bacterium]|nr:tRNA pseudouridine(55) synthase TruB [Gammaproteobacteria bacterium]
MAKRDKLNLHGVVLLDKPAGMSSNRALQRVKHLYQARKAGHTGSLDPLATGLLPICLGQATKVSEYLLGADKKYQTLIKLGEETDTWDADGAIVNSRPVLVSEAAVEAALDSFRGAIEQVPPMYSALKKDGQPLYKLARQGQEIERPARAMRVHELSAERIDEHHYRLNVHCSSGFYIRSLAHDLGQALGCGAHVVQLRRVACKGITLDQAVDLEQLENPENRAAALLPIDTLLPMLPRAEISDAQAESLLQGRPTAANALQCNTPSRLYRPDGSLFAIGQVDSQGRLKTEKIFVLDG